MFTVFYLFFVPLLRKAVITEDVLCCGATFLFLNRVLRTALVIMIFLFCGVSQLHSLTCCKVEQEIDYACWQFLEFVGC